MSPGKAFILAGLILIVAGLFLTFGSKIPFLGKLPGDIRIEKDNFTFYFPVTTCILLSVLVSLLLWFFRR